jgi:hypothetical protein
VQDFVAKFGREIPRGQEINRNAQHLLQINLETAQIEKGGAGQRVDEQIEITAVGICAGEDRAKDAGIASPSGQDRFFYRFVVLLKSG